jgi:hypothetical protein
MSRDAQRRFAVALRRWKKTLEKIPVSIRVDADLIERLRNAVWHLGHGLTITSVIEEAVTKAVQELEGHNGGKPFPTRSTRLPKSPPRRSPPHI